MAECGNLTKSTFELRRGGRAIKFYPCRVISWNSNDVKQRYCGRCHRFITKPKPTEAKIPNHIRARGL